MQRALNLEEASKGITQLSPRCGRLHFARLVVLVRAKTRYATIRVAKQRDFRLLKVPELLARNADALSLFDEVDMHCHVNEASACIKF